MVEGTRLRDQWRAQAGTGDSEAAPPVRAGRLWLFAAAVVGCLVVLEVFYIGTVLIGRPGWWRFAQDYGFYHDVGARWLADGSYYLPRQLAGPHVAVLMVDVLYPPFALLLFVPFAILPAVLWWAVPIGLTLYVLRQFKPEPWAICIMLVLLLWPRAIGAFLFGNTDMWMMAGVAAGLRFGWPAVLLTIKPSLALFALLGVRRRSWWIVAGLLGLVSLLMLPLWLDYLRVMSNVSIGWTYSLGSIPLLLVPIVAWLGARRRQSLVPGVVVGPRPNLPEDPEVRVRVAHADQLRLLARRTRGHLPR